jgi:hypothetical protein
MDLVTLTVLVGLLSTDRTTGLRAAMGSGCEYDGHASKAVLQLLSTAPYMLQLELWSAASMHAYVRTRHRVMPKRTSPCQPFKAAGRLLHRNCGSLWVSTELESK